MSEQDFQRHAQKFQTLSLHDVRQVFGKGMTKQRGNDILSRLQKRRITGTLDHETKAPSADAEVVEQALTWLRREYPLDEEAAIVKRIEREEGDNEKKFIEEADRFKNWHPQQSAESDGIYGKPMVDEFAKMWNERRVQRMKEKEERRRQYAELKANYEAQRITDSSGRPSAEMTDANGQAISTGQRETAEWIKRYREKGRLSDMLEPPKMSKARRLLPSYLVGGIVILFCAYFAVNYKAPPGNARMFPEWPVSVVTLYTMTSIMLLVFLCWRAPPLWNFMNRNFIMIVATPAARTIVTASLSHAAAAHFIGNMIALWLIGLPLHEEVGRGIFLAIYFTSAVMGGLFGLTRHVWMKQLDVTILGASGGICGLWAAWGWLPSRKDEGDNFKSWGSWLGRPDLDNYSTLFWRILVIGLLVVELSRLNMPPKAFDHWGHIGGYLSGIGSAELLLWRTRNNQKEKSALSGQSSTPESESQQPRSAKA